VAKYNALRSSVNKPATSIIDVKGNYIIIVLIIIAAISLYSRLPGFLAIVVVVVLSYFIFRSTLFSKVKKDIIWITKNGKAFIEIFIDTRLDERSPPQAIFFLEQSTCHMQHSGLWKRLSCKKFKDWEFITPINIITYNNIYLMSYGTSQIWEFLARALAEEEEDSVAADLEEEAWVVEGGGGSLIDHCSIFIKFFKTAIFYIHHD